MEFLFGCRRVQLVNGSCYINLPRPWARAHKLEEGGDGQSMSKGKAHDLSKEMGKEVLPWITTLISDFVILLAIIAFYVGGQLAIYAASLILNSINYTVLSKFLLHL